MCLTWLPEKCTREVLAILILIEPGALDVEELEAGDAARQRKGVDRELGDRLVRGRIRFVIQDVHCAVAHLQKVDVTGDDARATPRAALALDWPARRFRDGHRE